MTAKAVFTGREIGATRALAWTLRMVGMVLFIVCFLTRHRTIARAVARSNRWQQIQSANVQRARRRMQRAGLCRARSPACPARTASSRRRVGRAAENDAHADERPWRYWRGW